MPASQPTPIAPGYARIPAFDESSNSYSLADESRAAEPPYLLGEMIARGGMGVVFEAKHRELGRSVALKIVRGAHLANSHELGRFKAETEAAARLDHPNIVPIYDVGEMHGQPYFTMKLIEGGSLADRLKKGALSVRDAAVMMVKIARAVQHAHERGVLHRDLKPGNILLDTQNEPYLTDFGLAKFAETDMTLTMPGEVIGTPEYMAPEQTRGDELTTRCDVWALGVLLYQMISGRTPFSGTTALEIVEKIGNEEPPPISAAQEAAGLGRGSFSGKLGIDRDVATLVGRCLEKEPAARMATAGLLADEIQRWLDGVPIRSRRVTQAERVVKWARRHPGTVIAAALIVLCIAAGSVTSFFLWQKAETSNFLLHSTNGTLSSVNTKLNSTNDTLNSVNSKLNSANSELERSLRHATATLLASESRVQLQADSRLGVALAVESAELTRRVGEPVQPAAIGALTEAVRLVGGVDFSPARGYSDVASKYQIHAARFVDWPCMGTLPITSPDGRWLVTAQYTDIGLFFALYNAGLPLDGKPLRRFLIKAAKPDPGLFAHFWSPDSLELVTVEKITGELRAWDILAGIDAGPRADDDLSLPASRVLYNYAIESGNMHVVKGADGLPTGMLRAVEIGGKHPLFWHPVDMVSESGVGRQFRNAFIEGKSLRKLLRSANILPAGYGRIETLSKLSLDLIHCRRNGFIDSWNGRWLLNYDVYYHSPPVLLRIPFPGAAPCPVGFTNSLGIIEDAVFSPDDRWLAIASEGAVHLVDLVSSEESGAVRQTKRIAKGNHLAMSPDGTWLVSVSDGVVQMTPFNENGPQLAEQFNYRLSECNSHQIAISADGKLLAVGGDDGVVRVVSLAAAKSGGKAMEYRGLAGAAMRVQFSADGKIVTAISRSGDVRRWEANGFVAGVSPAFLGATPTLPDEMAISPDGRWIAMSGGYYTQGISAVYLRDMQTGAMHKVTTHDRPRAAAFSHCGKWFATSGLDGHVRRWNWPALVAALENNQPIPAAYACRFEDPTHPESHHMAIHPSGRVFVTFDGGAFCNLNIEEGKGFFHYFHSANYHYSELTISPDGKWLALGRHGGDTEPLPGQTQYGDLVLLIDCSDLDHLRIKHELRNSFGHLGQIRFSADGRWLASSGQNAPARVWDLSAKDIAASAVDSPFSSVLMGGLAFSPPTAGKGVGRVLACGDSSGAIYLWDWERDPSSVRRINAGAPVASAVFLPDGRLVTGSSDHALRAWELDPDRLIDIAREVAGRGLTDGEKVRFVGKQSESSPR